MLKYGVFEIFLFRLSSLYDCSSDSILLSNGWHLTEMELASYAFGCYAHTYFQYCRHMKKFNLTEGESAIYEALLYFSDDRPHLSNRCKIGQLQQKYSTILNNLCLKIHSNVPMFFSNLLLSTMKLRCVDVLSKYNK